MSQTLKTVIFVAVGLIGVALAGYLVWNLLLAPSPSAGPLGDSQNQEAPSSLKPVAISAKQAFDYWINKKTGEIYYVESTGEINKIAASGEEQPTGSKALGNMSHLKASADGSRIIVAFGYPQTPTFTIHSVNEKTWQALPEGATAAAWHPQNNDRVVYLRDNGSASNLFTLDLATRRTQSVLRLSQKDLELDWVTADLVYLKDRPSGQAGGSAWAFNLRTNTLRKVAGDEAGLSFSWPSGATRGFKWSNGSLKMVDLNGAEVSSFDIKTLPAKCAIANDNAYCAAPINQNAADINYPDDYFKRTRPLRDDFYLTPPNGIALKYLSSAVSGVSVDAYHLETQGDRLLFINREDQKLYSLDIQ